MRARTSVLRYCKKKKFGEKEKKNEKHPLLGKIIKKRFEISVFSIYIYIYIFMYVYIYV